MISLEERALVRGKPPEAWLEIVARARGGLVYTYLGGTYPADDDALPVLADVERDLFDLAGCDSWLDFYAHAQNGDLQWTR